MHWVPATRASLKAKYKRLVDGSALPYRVCLCGSCWRMMAPEQMGSKGNSGQRWWPGACWLIIRDVNKTCCNNDSSRTAHGVEAFETSCELCCGLLR